MDRFIQCAIAMWGGMCSGQISTGLITCQNNYLSAKDEGNYNTIGGLSVVHRSGPGYDQCDSELGSYPGQVMQGQGSLGPVLVVWFSSIARGLFLPSASSEHV